MTQNIILHGDSRDLIDKIPHSVNCVIADPPYGVNFVSRRAITPEGKKWVAPVDNDKELESALLLFNEVMLGLIPKMADNSDLYVFTRWDIVDVWMQAVRALPTIAYKMLLVWDKGIPGMGDIDANWGCGHELILYCKRGRRDVAYRRSGIIAVDKVHPAETVHPTEKPVGLLEKLIEMSTAKDDLVVDPFSGSGSTSVAAQRLGRNSIGIDTKENYVQIARNRLSNSPLF